MEYTDFKADFVNRTIDILNELSDKTDKEVTLLINCLFGLIVIPTESKDLLTDEQQKTYNKFWIDQLKQHSEPGGKFSTKYRLVRCMKNALSHINIDTVPEDGKISLVKFRDQEGKNATEIHTEIVFSVDKLETFARNVAKQYLKIRSNNS